MFADPGRVGRFARTVSLAGLSSCLCSWGCAGANPLLHPAHTLKQNQLSIGSGVSSRVVLGASQRKIDQAQTLAASDAIDNGDDEQAFVEGALLERNLSPGLTPWIGGRVGLGQQWEAGMAYSGYRLRIDGRHAFENQTWALSFGAGASVLLMQLDEPGPATVSAGSGADQRLASDGYEFSASGWGFELPVLLGMRTRSRWFEPWLGLRIGYDQVSGSMPLTSQVTPPGASSEQVFYADAVARRFGVDGTIGLSAGSAPVFLRLELVTGLHRTVGAVDFSSEAGMPAHRRLGLTGLYLQPAAALVVEL